MRPSWSPERRASARPGSPSEVARRARGAGFEVLLGRSIDLVGTELPYQPFAEALRPLGKPWPVGRQTPGSQLRVFEETLALLTGCAASAPVLLVLEDLHWADTSTLDLVVFLAHNLDDRPVLLLATYRADEPSSAERMRRLADGVRRSGSALMLELGPLERDELTALLAAHAGHSLPAALTDAIAARSEGNPFFAEELLAASGEQRRELPRRCATCCCSASPASTSRPRRAAPGRGGRARSRLPAAPRDRGAARRRPARLAPRGGGGRRPGRRAGDRELPFRHALLAEAIYATILPGEREELHARLAEELARSGAAEQRSSRPTGRRHAARQRRSQRRSKPRARPRPSSAWRRPTRTSSGRSRSGPRCRPRPSLPRLDLAGLCAWAAELASQAGAAPRAVELARQAIELVGAE